MPPKKQANESVLGPKSGGNWGPATKKLGRKKAGKKVNGVQRPARYPAGARVKAEIHKYQRDGGYVIPKAPFYRLCQEIISQVALQPGFRCQKVAVEILQVAAEQYLAQTMTAGNLEAAHAGRITLMASDLRIVREVVGVMSGIGEMEAKEHVEHVHAERQAKRARHKPPRRRNPPQRRAPALDHAPSPGHTPPPGDAPTPDHSPSPGYYTPPPGGTPAPDHPPSPGHTPAPDYSCSSGDTPPPGDPPPQDGSPPGGSPPRPHRSPSRTPPLGSIPAPIRAPTPRNAFPPGSSSAEVSPPHDANQLQDDTEDDHTPPPVRSSLLNITASGAEANGSTEANRGGDSSGGNSREDRIVATRDDSDAGGNRVGTRKGSGKNGGKGSGKGGKKRRRRRSGKSSGAGNAEGARENAMGGEGEGNAEGVARGNIGGASAGNVGGAGRDDVGGAGRDNVGGVSGENIGGADRGNIESARERNIESVGGSAPSSSRQIGTSDAGGSNTGGRSSTPKTPMRPTRGRGWTPRRSGATTRSGGGGGRPEASRSAAS